MAAVGTNYHVRVFQGSAIADAGHALGYPVGERRDLILFLRQEEGIDDDLVALEKLLRGAGWLRAVFSQVLTLSELPPPMDGDATLRNSYLDAMDHGGALLVCGEMPA